MSIDAELVGQRADVVRDTIARLSTRPVRVVAVTKGFGVDAVTAALDAGFTDIGENYAQEMVAKADALAALDVVVPRWHFIGHLQSNKVKQIAEIVDVWQTVDSPKLGRQIATRAAATTVLVQVNSSRAKGQSGVALPQVPALVDELRHLNLDVQGLMTIGVAGDLDASAAVFERVRAMADDLELAECSMGMSRDLEQALAAGSTIVRVGTALFGPRQ